MTQGLKPALFKATYATLKGRSSTVAPTSASFSATSEVVPLPVLAQREATPFQNRNRQRVLQQPVKPSPKKTRLRIALSLGIVGRSRLGRLPASKRQYSQM